MFDAADGLMTMMDEKYKLKFARYIANLADSMADDEEVPEFFVENELRKWINDKFLLDPSLPPKTDNSTDIDIEGINEQYFNVIDTDDSSQQRFRSYKN